MPICGFVVSGKGKKKLNCTLRAVGQGKVGDADQWLCEIHGGKEGIVGVHSKNLKSGDTGSPRKKGRRAASSSPPRKKATRG